MSNYFGDAVIVATFGSADDNVRKIFDALVADVRQSFPTFEVRTAFTSNFMIRKLARQNVFVPTVAEEISNLRGEGFRRIFVLPTLLTAGEEFDNKIRPCATINKVECNVELKLSSGNPNCSAASKAAAAGDVEIISPLLSDDCSTAFDRKVFATVLDCYPHADDETLILVGHGSPHRHNPTFASLQRLAGDKILIGVIEPTGTPNFDDVVAKLPHATKIFLAPLLFNGGVHVNEDIAVTWRNRLTALGHQVRVSTVGLGAFESFRNLYVEKLREVICHGRTQD